MNNTGTSADAGDLRDAQPALGRAPAHFSGCLRAAAWVLFAGITQRPWKTAALVCVAAVLPWAVAWAATTARIAVTTPIGIREITRRPDFTVPSGWETLSGELRWPYIGASLTCYVPPRYPDCLNCDVAAWELRAGWPLHCLRAYWLDDQRPRWMLDDPIWSLLMPRDDDTPIRWSTGINPPSSTSTAKRSDWLPTIPMVGPYLVNTALYLCVLSIPFAPPARVWRRFIAVRRAAKGLCPACGYATIGLGNASGGRCPECGITRQT